MDNEMEMLTSDETEDINAIEEAEAERVIIDVEAEDSDDGTSDDIPPKTEEIADVELPEKVEIVGVKFKKSGKTYHFAPNGVLYKVDDKVIVDTARGQEFGYVSIPNREIKSSEIVSPLRSVLRMATDAENTTHEENLKKEVEAYNSCIMLIDKHHLTMKLIDVELTFDRSKLIFYFSSENRVDFRELVKDLAGSFHTRIEMRQIGIRDEAKILGGLGICGRPFCCSSFLQDFGQVSVKMAKEQNLSLNTAKISGACGRLMCCLRYEYDTYLAEKALTPKVDTRVMTPDGAGVVIDANPLAGIVKVHLDSASDANAQTVYVREDVVKESEYNGEKLTKTAIPDKSGRNDPDREFMPVITIEAPVEKAPEPEHNEERKPRPEKQEKFESPENPVEAEKSEKPERSERHERGRRDRRRHGGGNQNHSAPDQMKESVQNAEVEKKHQGDRKQGNRRNDRRRDDRIPKADQPFTNDQTNTVKPVQNNDAPEGQGKTHGDGAPFKKKHKPYYRNFKKKGNGGENKQ